MAMCIIADAQYCLQVLLSERRRVGHVVVTLTVLHPTEQPRAQIGPTRCQTVTSSSQYGNLNKDTCQTEVAFS